MDKRPHGVLTPADVYFFLFWDINVHTRPDWDLELCLE